MSNTVNRASEETRRSNSRAVADRNAWRKRYATVSLMINDAKRFRASERSYNIEINTALRSLQATARAMMVEREEIKVHLVESAYQWI